MAADLGTAAAQCYAHMYARWNAATLSPNMLAFNAAIIAVFPDDASSDVRTVSNWVVTGSRLDREAAPYSSASQLAVASDYVFRLLTAANFARYASRISVAQADAVLAAYNANLD